MKRTVDETRFGQGRTDRACGRARRHVEDRRGLVSVLPELVLGEVPEAGKGRQHWCEEIEDAASRLNPGRNDDVRQAVLNAEVLQIAARCHAEHLGAGGPRLLHARERLFGVAGVARADDKRFRPDERRQFVAPVGYHGYAQFTAHRGREQVAANRGAAHARPHDLARASQVVAQLRCLGDLRRLPPVAS